MLVSSHDLYILSGTLKPGGSNWLKYCESRVICPPQRAVTSSSFALFDFPSLAFPAMVTVDSNHSSKEEEESKADRVSGYLLTFADETWIESFDELEEYSLLRDRGENLYQRIEITVAVEALRKEEEEEEEEDDAEEGEECIACWTYVMDAEKVRAMGGVRVPSGDWPHLNHLSPRTDD